MRFRICMCAQSIRDPRVWGSKISRELAITYMVFAHSFWSPERIHAYMENLVELHKRNKPAAEGRTSFLAHVVAHVHARHERIYAHIHASATTQVRATSGNPQNAAGIKMRLDSSFLLHRYVPPQSSLNSSFLLYCYVPQFDNQRAIAVWWFPLN